MADFLAFRIALGSSNLFLSPWRVDAFADVDLSSIATVVYLRYEDLDRHLSRYSAPLSVQLADPDGSSPRFAIVCYSQPHRLANPDHLNGS